MAAITAPVVSRQLRKAGFLPVPPNREGVKVKGRGFMGGVMVVCDMDNEATSREFAWQIRDTLKALGYWVRISHPDSGGNIIYIDGKSE